MMSVNNKSAFSGHQGAKKTEVRILLNLYWPGLCQDDIRFCRSCDVCQGNIKKGIVKKVPLGYTLYWPGICQDDIRFCRSCDVCQGNIKKGIVKKVPLGYMPLIEKPFKRVEVDIVGQISPPSEAGHEYI